MAYVRLKRSALGTLCALLALINLRCGSQSNDFFQGSGGSVNGTSGSANNAGDANSGGNAGSSSSAGGSAQSGGQSSNAGAGSGVGMGGTETGAGGAGNAGSAGSSLAGAGASAGAAGSAGAVASGGAGAAGSANAGNGGNATSGSGGTNGGSANAGNGGSGGCSALIPTFTPRAPFVEFLIDRSSTMFAAGYWAPVRTSVLSVISALQSQIQFGVAAYTGVVGQTCPLDLTNLGSPALNDYAALNTAYSALGSAGMKTESPTAAALAALAALNSSAGPTNSAKFVFLITDGGQDFCDDEDMACGSDAVVYEIQALKAAGVTTKTFGIKGSLGLVGADLQDFENAGVGAAVGGNAVAIYDACEGSIGWTALAASLNRGPNQALGTYQQSGASTPSVLLDTTNTDSMSQALLSAAAGSRSCTFDVTGASIDLANAAQGSVLIDGAALPFNAANGWYLTSSTVLQLVGSACTKWQSPTSQQISFDFPCQSLE